MNARGRNALPVAVAFVVGLALGAAGMGLWSHRADRSWVDAGAQWVRLPSQAAAGALPQTFATPQKPWDYGAITRALPATVQMKPSILQVVVGAASGPVTLSLAKPDGSALISKEASASSVAGPHRVYFTTPTGQPFSVLVRNDDRPGPGSLEVRAVRYAAIADLSKKDFAEINRAGLN